MENRKFRLTKDDVVFEGDFREAEAFLHRHKRFIYESYNLKEPLMGWKIEREIRNYDLYVNKRFIDTDTSVARLLRRNGMNYNTYRKYIDNEMDGILIAVRSHYE